MQAAVNNRGVLRATEGGGAPETLGVPGPCMGNPEVLASWPLGPQQRPRCALTCYRVLLQQPPRSRCFKIPARGVPDQYLGQPGQLLHCDSARALLSPEARGEALAQRRCRLIISAGNVH